MNSEIFDRSVAFIQSIGIEIRFEKIEAQTILPGLSIQQGAIIIDEEKLLHPGDLLHEAGHIASVPVSERATLDEKSIAIRNDYKAEEMMAIAWSYAACKHLDIDPEFVFHEEGYRTGSDTIVEDFENGKVFGLPMLEWTGMALDKKKAAIQGKPAFPKMLKWVRG